MPLDTTLLHALRDGRWHSGEALAQRAGVSRAAIWKQIRRLRAHGLEVQSVNGVGYRLARPLALLDSERICAFLRDRGTGTPTVDVLAQCDSTNAVLMARRLVAVPVACLAEHQSAGRGRRGRAWLSPFGANVYLSVGWRFSETPPGFAALPLAVGVRVAAYLSSLGGSGIGVKWPNDLVVGNRKLGGILVEQRGEAGGPWQVVVGIGLNIAMSRDQGQVLDQPWVSLNDIFTGAVPDRSRLAAGLIDVVLDVSVDLARAGFQPFRGDWDRFDAVRDCSVRMQMPRGSTQGVARGVDEDGALLLDTTEGRHRFLSGEVSLRPMGGGDRGF